MKYVMGDMRWRATGDHAVGYIHPVFVRAATSISGSIGDVAKSFFFFFFFDLLTLSPERARTS